MSIPVYDGNGRLYGANGRPERTALALRATLARQAPGARRP
jgi:hypothetical protein